MSVSERRITVSDIDKYSPHEIVVMQSDEKIELFIRDGDISYGILMNREQAVKLCMFLMHAVEEASGQKG